MLYKVKPIDLVFDQYGEGGPPMVIVHGLFGYRRNWSGIARKLSDNFSVTLPDLRNHGASPQSTPMDIPHLAADLSWLLERQGINSAIFVGHSLGGKAAMWLALTEPEKVRGFIAVDIAPVTYTHDFDEIFDALRSLDLNNVKNRKDADAQLSRHISHAGLRQFLLQNLIYADHKYAWRVDLDILHQAMPELLSFPTSGTFEPYTGPAMFIRAENSKYLLPEHNSVISALFPNAHVELIENAGHWVNVDQPERVLELLRDFLGQCS